MQVIIDYFKNNPKFTTTLLITLAVCLIVCIAIVIFRKMRFKNLQNNSAIESLNCANEEQNCEFCQDDANQNFENDCDCDNFQTHNEDNLSEETPSNKCENSTFKDTISNECDSSENQLEVNLLKVEENQTEKNAEDEVENVVTQPDQETILENSEDENELQVNSRYAGK